VDAGAARTPLRFDYDSQDASFVPVEHPRCHLHLGQFEGCRVPVSSPLCPTDFINFVLRNFYNSCFRTLSLSAALVRRFTFKSCIHRMEQSLPYIAVGR
jgi:hypothetical protein